jgi:hypothetical protein
MAPEPLRPARIDPTAVAVDAGKPASALSLLEYILSIPKADDDALENLRDRSDTGRPDPFLD